MAMLNTHSELIHTLADIATRLNSELDQTAVLSAICDEITRVINADGASVRLYDPYSDALVRVAVTGIKTDWRSQATMSRVTFEAAMQQFRQPSGVAIVPDALDPVAQVFFSNEKDFYHRANIRTMMMAEIRRKHELVGMLVVASHGEVHEFSDDDQALMLFVTEMAAQALANARLYETSQRRAQELQLLDKVRVAVVRELDLDSIIRTVGEATAQTFGYKLVCTFKIDNDDLILLHQVGWTNPMQRIPMTTGIMARVARTQEPAFVPDVNRDPDLVNPAPGAVSEICVPLIDQDKVYGVLNIESDRLLTHEDFELIKAVGEEVNIAIGRARLYEEAKQQRDFAVKVMNAMGEGLAVVDCNNKFTYINPTLSHMMDIKPEDWVGKKLDQELFQEDPVALSELQTKVHKGDQYRYELRHVHQNGSILPVLITATPNTLNGEFDGYIAVLTDLTEEARIREAAMIARDQALTAARLRAEFIARLSHELRTPMNGILGMAELLSESGLTPEQREMSDTVYECGQSLMYLINDLLDFSKIEAGKMQLDISHFEVVTVINAVLKLLGAKAQAKGLYVKTQIESLVPRFLIGDANRLRQILTNLVGNAIKFTEHGGVYIKVSKIEITSVHAHDLVKPAYYGAVTVSNTLPIWLRFEVIDSGIGLAEPMRKNLFQPFIQGDMSITRKYGGTGLGLAICKNLVGLMNGDIGVTSTEGKGSTFWFTAQFGSSDRHLN